MENERLESLLIDYIDGTLSDPDLEWVENELQTNGEFRLMHEQLRQLLARMDESAVYAPSADMSDRFHSHLVKEGKLVQKKEPIRLWYKVAAAIALLIMSSGIGYWWSRQEQKEELLVLQREMEATRQLVMSSLMDETSASNRMIAVQTVNTSFDSDDEIVDALVRVMNTDVNPNVRMAAIEALGKFQTEPEVRKALIGSLEVQTDPAVQISLIQLLVRMKVQQAADPLQELIEKEDVLPAVKDEAYVGLLKLS